MIEFTTTADLLARLREHAGDQFDAVFHAAAVSDFGFGAVFERTPDGALQKINSGKYSTRKGRLLAELVPTPKIIAELRGLFPSAKIVGWKYEVNGTSKQAVEIGKRQIQINSIDCTVVNGPAYGSGWGIVSGGGLTQHCPSPQSLAEELLRLCSQR